MAKKALSLRERSRAEEVVKEGPGRGRRGKAGEHKGRGSRQRTARQELVNQQQQNGAGDGGESRVGDQQGNGQAAAVQHQHVEEQQRPALGQSLSAGAPPSSWPSESRRSPDKVSRDSGVTSPSDGGSVTTDCSEQAPDSLESQHTATHVLSVHSTPSSGKVAKDPKILFKTQFSRSDGAGSSPGNSNSKTSLRPPASCSSAEAAACQGRACHNRTRRRAAEQPKTSPVERCAAAGPSTLPHSGSPFQAGEHLLRDAHQRQWELTQQRQRSHWEFAQQCQRSCQPCQ